MIVAIYELRKVSYETDARFHEQWVEKPTTAKDKLSNEKILDEIVDRELDYDKPDKHARLVYEHYRDATLTCPRSDRHPCMNQWDGTRRLMEQVDHRGHKFPHNGAYWTPSDHFFTRQLVCTFYSAINEKK